MASRGVTRERMLVTTGRLLRRQGLHATGTNQILAESGSPRGSLYFHFPEGKEQLAVESLARAGRELGTRMGTELDRARDPADAVVRLGEMFIEDLLASDFRDGCPIATVALETASESELVRGVCEQVYGAWQVGLADRLHHWGLDEDAAAHRASLILASLQGALLLARVSKDVGIVRDVCHQLATPSAA